MIAIRAIRIVESFDFKQIGILMFAEYPTTIIFADDNGLPIIKEWVDCDEDDNTDRYFFYRTNKYLLKQFISGQLSHNDFILGAEDGLLYFEDVKGNTVIDRFVLAPNHLPGEYKPPIDYFFEESNGVELNNIIEHFGLDKIIEKPEASIMDTVKQVSYERKAETFNIHFNQGVGVGYGSIDTDVLGKILVRVDGLYKGIALDYLLGKNRGDVKLTPSKKEEIRPYISTEVTVSKAASYSIFLKPKNSRFGLFTEGTDSETVAQRFFNLIKNSFELDTLKLEYLEHSDNTIKSYKSFLSDIYSNELKLDFNFFSPSSLMELNQDLNYHKANLIIESIKNLDTISEDKFPRKGRFRAVNLNTGHFIFISLNDEEFHGYFDKLIREGSKLINFISIYGVEISRKLIKIAGRPDAKIEDTLIAFYEDKE